MSHKPGYENEKAYNAGIPDISDERLEEIYQKAGIDFVTGKQLVMTGKVVNGGQTEITVPTFALKQAAAACGCISCAGVLENIRSAVMWYAKAEYHAPITKRWARQNRNYFIQQLRGIIASQVVKHNEKQGE